MPRPRKSVVLLSTLIGNFTRIVAAVKHEAPIFSFEVQLTGTDGRTSDWSAPFFFAMELPRATDWLVPIWASNRTQQYVLLRRSFRVPPESEAAAHYLLHITARNVPMRYSEERERD